MEKSGLECCEMEDRREGGRGFSSLSEPITISRIPLLDSTRAHFAHKTSPCCTFNKTSAQLTRQTAKSLLKGVKLLQAAWWYKA
jgi:hypothetical protein